MTGVLRNIFLLAGWLALVPLTASGQDKELAAVEQEVNHILGGILHKKEYRSSPSNKTQANLDLRLYADSEGRDRIISVAENGDGYSYLQLSRITH